MSNLTNTDISKLEIKDREYVVSDTEIKKLKIRIAKSGSKIFYLYWKRNGKLNKYRIAYSGPSLPLIPLEACHPFHSKAATDSGESCHPETGV